MKNKLFMIGQKKLEIGLSGFLIIVGFFAVKLFNEFIYNEIIQRKQGIIVLAIGAAFVITTFGLSVFTEKVINNKAVFVYGWLFIIFVIILGTVLYSPAVLALALAGIMFYSFIGSEAQVLRSMEENFGLSRILLTSISIPLFFLSFIYADFFNINPIQTGAIFLVESIFALLVSYNMKRHGAAVIMENPPIFLGVFFMAISLIIFYVSGGLTEIIESNINAQSFWRFNDKRLIGIMFVVPFYFAGAMIVYLSIENKIIKLAEKFGLIDSGGKLNSPKHDNHSKVENN